MRRIFPEFSLRSLFTYGLFILRNIRRLSIFIFETIYSCLQANCFIKISAQKVHFKSQIELKKQKIFFQ